MQATERDPRKLIRGWGTLTTEVASRIAPILLLVHATTTADPQMARLQSELNAQRLERMTHNARNLANRSGLRAEVTVERAGEILWTYSSPELYELRFLTRGWPLDNYGTFSYRWLFSQGISEPPGVDYVLADALNQRRVENQKVDDKLARYISAAVVVLAVEAAGFAVASALAA